MSIWYSRDCANLPSSAYVLITSFPLQCREVFYSSPLLSLLCNIAPPSPPTPMCTESHLWTEEGRRKGRGNGNGILLFVMGLGNMINFHSVYSTQCFGVFTLPCTNECWSKYYIQLLRSKPNTIPPYQVRSNCDKHRVFKYHKHLVSNFMPILNRTLGLIPIKLCITS